MRRYFAGLDLPRRILWCYALWYAVSVATRFDANPRVWLTSLGLSVIIGTALVLGIRSGRSGPVRLDRWQVFRLYLMPFCVSSFAALVKDAGYVLVFPPDLGTNLVGITLISLFLIVTGILARKPGPSPR